MRFLLVRTFTLGIMLFTLSSTAKAAALKADALVCESDAALSHVLSNPKMAVLPGSEAITKSKAQIELLQPSAQGDATAATMRRINPDSQKRLEQLEKTALDGARDVVAKCASSGTEPLSVAVLEQRPISGISRVSLTFRGSAVQLYAASASVRE